MCYLLATVQTFKTFGPSKLSDLQKLSDLHVEALSQHALSCTMLLLTPDIMQSDNYHPNMLKPQRYILAIVRTINPKKHVYTDSEQAGKKCMNRVSK